MKFVSRDEAGDRAYQVSSSNGKTQSNQKVKIDMSSGPESRENQINQVFDKIEEILCQTWTETGFGQVIIESERAEKGQGKIQVTVKGSIYYRYYIAAEDVEEWNSRR